MVRWCLLLLAVLLAASASLTVFRAPTLYTWMVAILVGEYGQYLWFLSFVVAATSYLTNRSHHSGWFFWSTVLLSAVAIALFLLPSSKAAEIAEALPARLDQAFGASEHRYAGAFTPLKYIFRTVIAKEPFETRVYEPGIEPQSLDFYRATGIEGPAPCVVVIHGGGWDSGNRNELPALDHLLTSKGYSVASIDYRLAPKHTWPAQAVDVKAALAYLRSHAVELGIDPKRFVLFGRSAGGQIATAFAYEVKDPSVRGVAAFYSPHDLRFAWIYADPNDVLNSALLLKQYTGGTPEQVGPVYDSASAIYHVTPATVPTLLVHGELDTLVWNKQSERLAAVLEKNHVPHLFLSLPWATHAFDYNIDGPSGQLAIYALLDFLTCVTR